MKNLETLFCEPLDPKELTEPYFLRCSGCYEPTSSEHGHVVPYWNHRKQDFVTAYRCDNCLDDTMRDARMVVMYLKDDKREEFCQFMERHRYREDTAFIRHTNLPQAQAFIEMFINSIWSGQIKLSP